MTINYTPFIVYALDSPVIPSGEIWPYDRFSPRNRVRYGYQRRRGIRAGLLHQPQEVKELEGSLIVLSGGYLIESGKTEGLSLEKTDMWLDGFIGIRDRVGERFAERAIAEMLDPHARVTMVLYLARDEAVEHLAAVRDAGFEVIVTGDVTPGSDSNFAVCLGNATMLKTYEWLSQVWPYEPYFFLSNRGAESIIEKSIIEAARNRTNPEAVAVAFLKDVEQAPDTAEKFLGEHYVYINRTDPEMKSLLIMRSDPDVSNVERLFHKAAHEVGVALFDAGSLDVPDAEGYYFTEFPFWDREMPVPGHWRRIV